jgi:hypothetical protein
MSVTGFDLVVKSVSDPASDNGWFDFSMNDWLS